MLFMHIIILLPVARNLPISAPFELIYEDYNRYIPAVSTVFCGWRKFPAHLHRKKAAAFYYAN